MIRTYNKETDREAGRRIWTECGWLDDMEPEVMDAYVDSGHAWVADINGSPECLCLATEAEFQYINDKLPLSAITGLTTSHIGRKQGLAGKLLAHALASEVADGKVISMLGMFEQGFYDRLGYGSGAYHLIWQFDPADINVNSRHPVPERITLADAEAVHKARLKRMPVHGAVNLLHAEQTRHNMVGKERFGLGYRDTEGNITHCLWINPKDMAEGPYRVLWAIYETYDQFVELMSILKSLGDQVNSVIFEEPSGIQMQDFLTQPLKRMEVTKGSKFLTTIHAMSYFQTRILNLEAVMEQTHLECKDFHFNLSLTDPIRSFLSEDTEWNGIEGEYVVTLGRNCKVETGSIGPLPTLDASVGAFTRMWTGVRPATGLAVTDNISGPPDLMKMLDRAFLLPVPYPNWDF